MNYWLDLFTGVTWNQFREAGSKVTGFNKRSGNIAKQVKPGDILVCYLTGVMRWVGLLEVIQLSSNKDPIWGANLFPVRFDVKPLILLDPEYGIPMQEFEGSLSFYKSEKDRGKFKGFVRQSLNRFSPQDGPLVCERIKEAKANPHFVAVDPKKLAKKPFFQVKLKKGDKSVSSLISVPEAEEPGTTDSEATAPQPEEPNQHTTMQYELLRLGAAMGFDVWVAKNDRKKKVDGTSLESLPRMLTQIPTQFTEPAQKIVEYIDVLWLDKKTIVAAFEVEHTTSIYSGLLRMSDLLALVPNLNISLYIVSPEERRPKVQAEVTRPTFTLLSTPLSELCRFLPFDVLLQKTQILHTHNLAGSLRPEFIVSISESLLPAKSASV